MKEKKRSETQLKGKSFISPTVPRYEAEPSIKSSPKPDFSSFLPLSTSLFFLHIYSLLTSVYPLPLNPHSSARFYSESFYTSERSGSLVVMAPLLGCLLLNFLSLHDSILYFVFIECCTAALWYWWICFEVHTIVNIIKKLIFFNSICIWSLRSCWMKNAKLEVCKYATNYSTSLNER